MQYIFIIWPLLQVFIYHCLSFVKFHQCFAVCFFYSLWKYLFTKELAMLLMQGCQIKLITSSWKMSRSDLFGWPERRTWPELQIRIGAIDSTCRHTGEMQASRRYEAQSETSSSFQRTRKLLLQTILREHFVNHVTYTSIISNRLESIWQQWLSWRKGKKNISEVLDPDVGGAGPVLRWLF